MDVEKKQRRMQYRLVMDRINLQFTDFHPDTYDDQKCKINFKTLYLNF